MKKKPIGIKPNTQNEQYRGIKMSTHQHINLATKSINLITYVLTLQKKKRREVCADIRKVGRQSDYLVHAPPNGDKVDI